MLRVSNGINTVPQVTHKNLVETKNSDMQIVTIKKIFLNPETLSIKNCRTVAAKLGYWALYPTKTQLIHCAFEVRSSQLLFPVTPWQIHPTSNMMENLVKTSMLLQKNRKDGNSDTMGIPEKGHPSEIRPL